MEFVEGQAPTGSLSAQCIRHFARCTRKERLTAGNLWPFRYVSAGLCVLCPEDLRFRRTPSIFGDLEGARKKIYTSGVHTGVEISIARILHINSVTREGKPLRKIRLHTLSVAWYTALSYLNQYKIHLLRG